LLCVALHFTNWGTDALVCVECASTFRRVQAIATARVPIIKLVDATTGCLVDISFDVPTGPAHINLIKVCPFPHPHAARSHTPHTPHSHSRTTRQLCTIASYSLRRSLAAAYALSSVNLFGWLMIGGAGEHSRLVGPHTPLLRGVCVVPLAHTIDLHTPLWATQVKWRNGTQFPNSLSASPLGVATLPSSPPHAGTWRTRARVCLVSCAAVVPGVRVSEGAREICLVVPSE
jgi:hypothetical protein